jgi:hypothetical protein
MRVVGHLARCAGHIVVLARERAHPRAYTPGLPREIAGTLSHIWTGGLARARARGTYRICADTTVVDVEMYIHVLYILYIHVYIGRRARATTARARRGGGVDADRRSLALLASQRASSCVGMAPLTEGSALGQRLGVVSSRLDAIIDSVRGTAEPLNTPPAPYIGSFDTSSKAAATGAWPNLSVEQCWSSYRAGR